jgi:peptidoglycan/xylan/chitin deacetylase (PgdA/CDA1 family)
VWLAWPVYVPAAVAFVLTALVADGIARPQSSLFFPTITHGPRALKQVALTFDDGPDSVLTPRVLVELREHGARATFFVVGSALAARPDLGARMVAEGHALGNHSWQHSRLQNFHFRAWQSAEIERCETAIDAVAGQDRVKLYRPPVGLKIGALAGALWPRPFALVAWSLHSHDTRGLSTREVAERVLKRVRGGDIVLLHDGYAGGGPQRAECGETLRLVLAGLDEKGLECVTVPELLSAGAGRR